jgi:phospholipid/cholesterol/gamma-HCH transport system substrate-binding protein
MTSRQASLAGSPLLVGVATVLVTIVAVFLSYNANQGLPFVPTYDLTAEVPDAAGLVKGNEVRVGGKRVGIVRSIDAHQRANGQTVAKLDLKLETTVEPVRSDAQVTVRPRSPLGLKYVELVRGVSGKPLPDGAALPASAARKSVDLDEVLNAFDAETRRSGQIALDALGTGLTGRGADVNRLLEAAPELTGSLRRVAANVASPRTNLRGFIRGLDRTVSELAPVARELGSLVASSDVTAGALASVSDRLAEGIGETPPTEAVGIRALAASRPALQEAAALIRDVRPGAPLLLPATRRLHAALETGTPVLRRAVALAGRLESTLAAVERLSRDPATRRTLDRLLAALVSAKPTVDFVAPFQIECNYLGLWTRNVNDTISEGDATGNWFRTVTVTNPNEGTASATPAPNLHVNPYPHTAAPGQGGECESGNEPFLPGQRIGNVPGNQGGKTEQTRPPAGVPQP